VATGLDTERFDGGEAIAQALRSLAVDCVFSSPGSEWGPVWEAFARQTANRIPGPRFYNCGHETLAVDLALGYTLASGRMQAVLLHAGSGLMQGSMAIHSALTSSTPMVLLSGESIGYGDDQAYDPGSQWYAYLGVVGGMQRLMEPFSKWSEQAANPGTLHDMVIRAGELARAAPMGPAYLNVTVEALAAPCRKPVHEYRPRPVPPAQVPDAELVQLAEQLLAAKNPVVMTESAGRDRAAYESLAELCALLAIPVVESPFITVSNLPKQHPLHQGFDAKPLVDDADLVLIVRNRVPWYPPSNRPGRAKVVVLDEQPFRASMVYQNYQADRYLEGDVPSALARLCALVTAAKPDAARVRERLSGWSAAHAARESGIRAEIERAREGKRIRAPHVCATLSEVFPEDTIFVDETTSHRGAMHRFLGNRGHLSFVRSLSGLGQSLGLSLGIKLAAPERPVVTLLGDGAFLYNPVVPALGFAAHNGVPLIAIVFNNGVYQSMQRHQAHDYPEGAGVRHGLFYGGQLHGAQYEGLAAPLGAVGIRVEDPAMLAAALREAHSTARSGKSVLVNVLLEA